MRSRRRIAVAASVAVLAFSVSACGGGGGDEESTTTSTGDPTTSTGDLSGVVRVDGSSIVAPLTEAVAAGFQEANPGVTVRVGSIGTGAGFEAVCASRVDVGDAAWRIDPKARKLCKEAGVAYVGLPVAAQALAVLVNEENPVDCLTIEQLEAIWEPTSTISNWEEIPDLKQKFDEKLVPFEPEGDSGAFEYFTEATDGVVGGTRTDYNKVGGNGDAMFAAVAGAPGGMGYLNFLSYTEGEDAVKALEVDSGKGCVAPSVETAQDGSYASLSRPMILYLDRAALKKPLVKAFIEYYLENVSDVAESAGLVPLGEQQVKASEAIVKKAGT